MEPHPSDPVPPPVAPTAPPGGLPILTGLTVAIAVVMYGLCVLRGESLDPTPEVLREMGGPSANEVWSGAWWALLTSAFLHVGLLHLVFNCAWLVDLGKPIERLAGRGWFMALLLGGAVASSGIQLAVGNDTGVGASGVVYAMAAFVWMSRERDPAFVEALGPRGMTILVLWALGCWVATAQGLVLIGNAAHFSGLAFGLALGQACAGARLRSLAAAAAAALVVAGAVSAACMPWSADWWANRGRQHMNAEPARAVDDFTRALALDPRQPLARYGRALLHQQQGRSEEALADLNAYIAQAPHYAPAYRKRAELHAALGRISEALADYSREVELEPSLDAFWGRATCRWRAGELEGALADYRACMSRTQDPENRSALAENEGQLLLELDRPAEAVAPLRRALELRPDEPELLEDLATACQDAGEEEAARATWEKLARGPAKDVDELQARGRAHLTLGDRAAALADAEAALVLDPRWDPALTRRSLLRLGGGDTAGARADALAALEIDPKDGYACMLAALASIDSHGKPAAVELLARARDTTHEGYASAWSAGIGGPPPPLPGVVPPGKQWEAELIKFARGELDERGLLAAADASKTPLRVKECRSEAYALIGLFAEQSGDVARAREHYQASVDAGVHRFIEHQWALLRLKVLPAR